MALTVEDGTGKSDADAFISLTYFKAYCDARGHTYGTDTLIEQAIIRATDFLSDSYHWQGFKLKERGHSDGEQALAWPRTYVQDRNGYAVASDIVPDEVQRATAEVTRRELETPGAMTPDYTASERVKSERVGSLAVEYDMTRTDAESVRPVLLVVRDLIGPFLKRGTGSRIVGSAARA